MINYIYKSINDNTNSILTIHKILTAQHSINNRLIFAGLMSGVAIMTFSFELKKQQTQIKKLQKEIKSMKASERED